MWQQRPRPIASTFAKLGRTAWCGVRGCLPGRAPSGHTLNRCVDYVLATPGGNGYLGVRGGRMYGHGIATLFLSEVSGMIDERRQRKLLSLIQI